MERLIDLVGRRDADPVDVCVWCEMVDPVDQGCVDGLAQPKVKPAVAECGDGEKPHAHHERDAGLGGA